MIGIMPSAGTQKVTISRLVLGSSLMLFMELALIRWLGSNVVHLSYFSNFVLLGSFLGIGLGFLIARKPWSVIPITPLLLALLVVIVWAFPVTIDRGGANIIYFTSLETAGPPAWLVLPIIFLLVAAILAGPAEVVGRCFAELDNLNAYRWDLIGSLAGIAAFTALSFARAPSVVWGLLVAVALVLLSDSRRRLVAGFAGLLIVGTLLLETLTPGVSWSPYYKVEGTDVGQSADGKPLYLITVNGIPHQVMGSAEFKLNEAEDLYKTPYERMAADVPESVLIIGAGSGSDVAIALAQGATSVDAVDIDPRIMEIGAELNPDQPYSDERVSAYVDDGRAFLESTDKKYDLILFALPDSLALVSGASQIRLESFLFTEEALASARSKLTDDGVFSMYNYYREPWLIDRLGGIAQEAFGHAPCVDLLGGAQAVVTVAKDPAHQDCGSDNHVLPADRIDPPTDNAPFLYFRGGGIPAVYLWTLAGILLLSAAMVRGLGGPFRTMRPYADLFLMGVAFMLLQTKYIATFALLFGTTWFVNALVFGGVLLIVLLAVETTRRWRTPGIQWLFGGIVASLAVAYVVTPESLLTLPGPLRVAVAVALAFAPIFLANVAFAKRFAASDNSRSAFGLNLLGALVGGCLEYAALVTGYSNLLILVLVIYLLAFALAPRRNGHIIAA
ncbi:spermidine synthase [Tessaracoccus sp. OS52]|uniref:spermine/spermidine synthase domain-containing protein n=1 Tax=Tessaracoccus sp. OS52 TaxID=2886691 RepID=UPI001D0F9C4C|nr:spermidine synthase [Tessaracoccus sp. OS52]MCC2593217.1 spermidine synthase [Tessaracoccus sp. OS52]